METSELSFIWNTHFEKKLFVTGIFNTGKTSTLLLFFSYETAFSCSALLNAMQLKILWFFVPLQYSRTILQTWNFCTFPTNMLPTDHKQLQVVYHKGFH
jgi:hypothetical protein